MSKIPDSINNHPNTSKKQIRDASKRDVIREQHMAHEARLVSGERVSQPSLNAAAEEQMRLRWRASGDQEVQARIRANGSAARTRPVKTGIGGTTRLST